jgi:hypothetical protein
MIGLPPLGLAGFISGDWPDQLFSPRFYQNSGLLPADER